MGDLDWLKGKPHECGPACRLHHAGTSVDETVNPPELAPSGGVRELVPAEGSPTPILPEDLCGDCDEPLDSHSSPILRDGVVVGLANPENSCKRYIPR